MGADNAEPCRTAFAWGRWISLFCAFSFLMLGVDATINHHKVITEDRLSWTPIILAPILIVMCLLAFARRSQRRLAWLPGLVGLLVGGAGTLIHNYYDLVDRGDLTIFTALVNAQRPPLAPSAFASTGILMLLVCLAEHWPVKWRRRAV